MGRIFMGIDLCFARKRWTEPKDWARLVRDELGLKYVEFCSDLLDPILVSKEGRRRITEKVKREFVRKKLSIVCYYTGLAPHCFNFLSHPDPVIQQDGFKWVKEAVSVSAEIGAPGFGGHYDHIPYREWTDDKRYRKNISNLISCFRKLSHLARRKGQKFILWEQMYTPNEVPYTISQTEEILNEVNQGASVPVYVTVDVGHACCQNYRHKKEDRDPYLWLERLADRSPVIHIQQTNSTGSHHWPFTTEYNKKGIIDPEKVLKAIEKSGSKENYLILEIFHSLTANEKQLLKDLKDSVRFWRRYIPKV